MRLIRGRSGASRQAREVTCMCVFWTWVAAPNGPTAVRRRPVGPDGRTLSAPPQRTSAGQQCEQHPMQVEPVVPSPEQTLNPWPGNTYRDDHETREPSRRVRPEPTQRPVAVPGLSRRKGRSCPILKPSTCPRSYPCCWRGRLCTSIPANGSAVKRDVVAICVRTRGQAPSISAGCGPVKTGRPPASGSTAPVAGAMSEGIGRSTNGTTGDGSVQAVSR